MDNLIIFGSAITKRFKLMQNLPCDIDALYTGKFDNNKVQLINQWAINIYGTILPIDKHLASIYNNTISVPCLTENQEYETLLKDESISIKTHIRNDGFASMLRLYGNNVDEFINALGDNIVNMSLLPDGISYYDDISNNMDKYYSGIQAFKNAYSHAKDGEKILQKINCGNLLKKLLTNNPINWQSSTDICKNPKSYGEGWSYAYTLHISKNMDNPVLIGWKNKLNENEAIKLIYNL